MTAKQRKVEYNVNKVEAAAIVPGDEAGKSVTQVQFEDLSGTVITLQEYAQSTQAAIWLGTPWGAMVDTPQPRIHLNQKLAGELIAHLQRFVETGKLGEEEVDGG